MNNTGHRIDLWGTLQHKSKIYFPPPNLCLDLWTTDPMWCNLHAKLLFSAIFVVLRTVDIFVAVAGSVVFGYVVLHCVVLVGKWSSILSRWSRRTSGAWWRCRTFPEHHTGLPRLEVTVMQTGYFSRISTATRTLVSSFWRTCVCFAAR